MNKKTLQAANENRGHTGPNRSNAPNDLEDEPKLPHERDESAGKASSSPVPRQVVEQAASDITRGLRDSERRGTPSDVPAPGPAPEHSPGGEAPPEGVDRESTASREEQMKKKADKP